jgi:ribokinase
MTEARTLAATDRELDLLVVGDVNPDIVVRGGEPRYGQQEVLVDAIALTIGGSASIMAAAAARLGLRVALVGVVGDDALGRFMLDELAARGVDVATCRIAADRPTGATVILAKPGDRAILTAEGTIPDLTPEDIPDGLLERTRHVHVASYFLQRGLNRALPAILDGARAAGATVSVDPNGDPSERWDGGLIDLLPRLDVFLPNEAEASAIAGRHDVADAARALAAPGPRPLVVVKRGLAGAIAVDAGGADVRVDAIPVEAVDAIGAGDAFDAGFLAAWLEGRPVRDCLLLGVACGALSTRGAGGTGSQPTRAEAEAVLGW